MYYYDERVCYTMVKIKNEVIKNGQFQNYEIKRFRKGN